MLAAAYSRGALTAGLAAGRTLDLGGYSDPSRARLVRTPRVGLTTSQHGREYRVGYGLEVLEKGTLSVQLGVDAQRRESATEGGAGNGFMGRATLGW